MTMQFPCLSPLLFFLELIAVAATSNNSNSPQQHGKLGHQVSTTLAVMNATSLTDRFEDISVTFLPYRARYFPVNLVALGFINIMKIQALEDCDQQVTSYTFTDTEYEDSAIRIRVNAVADAPQAQLIRCNMLYAIKTLAIEQLNNEHIYGARFVVMYRGRLIYNGIFDNLHDDLSLEKSSNASTDPSQTIAQEKGELSTQVLNATDAIITGPEIAGSNDVEYEVKFISSGGLIPKIGIFSAVLEFMMKLAQRRSDDTIGSESQARSTDPVWIFVSWDAESRFTLQVFEFLAILESLARWSVARRHYRELRFYFYMDGDLVAQGCVTAPTSGRRWCRGLP